MFCRVSIENPSEKGGFSEFYGKSFRKIDKKRVISRRERSFFERVMNRLLYKQFVYNFSAHFLLICEFMKNIWFRLVKLHGGFAQISAQFCSKQPKIKAAFSLNLDKLHILSKFEKVC